MFKIALNAGHFINTPGKRCQKSIDPDETREWSLNARICEYVEKGLQKYDGYSLLRIDDKTGKTDITLSQRAKKANNFGADIYISVHHNAGMNGKSGGGIMAYTYLKVDEKTKKLQKMLYANLIEATSLKGNRTSPLATADFAECRETAMPAVLLELGFMDSLTDTPVILTEDFAQKAAEAIVKSIRDYANLSEKEDSKLSDGKTMYTVRAGAFFVYENAKALADKLHDAGFDAYIKKENQ